MKKSLKHKSDVVEDDIRKMLIDACHELEADQTGRTAGDVIVKMLNHTSTDCRDPLPPTAPLQSSLDNEPDVKKIRKKLDYTQDQMARAIDVTPSTIKHWEQGIRKPKGPSKIVLEAMAIVAEKKLTAKNGESKINKSREKSEA